MAKTFLTNINLKGNQLLNAAIQPSASAPNALTAGQLYFNTNNNTFYYSTGPGTSSWEPVGVQYISSVDSTYFTVTNNELFLNVATIESHLTTDGFANQTDVTNAENAAKSYTDSSIITLSSTLSSQSSTDISNAITTAENYTDTAIANEVTRANSAYDPAGAATTAENNAKSYADSLASNYDPAGSASSAQTAAQSYADTAATNAENAAKSYADAQISALVDSAPSILDTLKKIDQAINNDANFSTTLLNDIATAQATAESYADTAATNAENAAKSYTDSQITALHLTSKYSQEISGDNSTDLFTITHNLNTRAVTVQVYQTSGTPDTQWADVEVDVTRDTTSTVTLGFGLAPSVGTTYEVVIVG